MNKDFLWFLCVEDEVSELHGVAANVERDAPSHLLVDDPCRGGLLKLDSKLDAQRPHLPDGALAQLGVQLAVRREEPRPEPLQQRRNCGIDEGLEPLRQRCNCGVAGGARTPAATMQLWDRGGD